MRQWMRHRIYVCHMALRRLWAASLAYSATWYGASERIKHIERPDVFRRLRHAIRAFYWAGGGEGDYIKRISFSSGNKRVYVRREKPDNVVAVGSQATGMCLTVLSSASSILPMPSVFYYRETRHIEWEAPAQKVTKYSPTLTRVKMANPTMTYNKALPVSSTILDVSILTIKMRQYNASPKEMGKYWKKISAWEPMMRREIS